MIDDGGRFDGNRWNFRRHSSGHGHGHGPKIGKNEKPYWIPTLDAIINWDTPDAYDSPGAPPNGSDYVRLRDSGGKYLSASQLKWISFDGETAARAEAGRVDGRLRARPGTPATRRSTRAPATTSTGRSSAR